MPIFKKGQKMTYLGVFLDLKESFLGRRVNILQNLMQISNVHLISFRGRCRMPIFKKV